MPISIPEKRVSKIYEMVKFTLDRKVLLKNPCLSHVLFLNILVTVGECTPKKFNYIAHHKIQSFKFEFSINIFTDEKKLIYS